MSFAWYVVQTQPGYQRAAAAAVLQQAAALGIADLVLETRVPLDSPDEPSPCGQTRMVLLPRFPGHVAVRTRLTDLTWWAVRHAPRTHRLAGPDDAPWPLASDEVAVWLAPPQRGPSPWRLGFPPMPWRPG